MKAVVKSLLLLFLFVCAAFPGAFTGPGPARAPAKESPHFNELGCGECHGKDLPEDVARMGGLKNLYAGLCRGCHASTPRVCTFHCDRFPSGDAEGTVAPTFPLNGKKIFCLTCHDARIQCDPAGDEDAKQSRLFLRGSPKGRSERFCFACHKAEKFPLFNVHGPVQKEAEAKKQRCLFCHAQIPGDAEQQAGGASTARNPDLSCRICHRVKDHPDGRKHLVKISRLEGIIKKQPADEMDNAWARSAAADSLEAIILLPLADEGMIRCVTCHDPHSFSGSGDDLLRTEGRDELCTQCHGKDVPLHGSDGSK